jgi:hypothetical protein
MKFFSKFTNGFGGFVLFLCLLVGVTFASSQNAMAESQKIIGSSEANGIKLTINNYAIQNYGQEMVLYYTVQSKSGQLMDEDGISLIKKPNLTIGDRRVQGNDTWHKKISNQIYQGAVKVQLPQYRPAVSNVEFNTDSILNQTGQWTITFQIKK